MQEAVFTGQGSGHAKALIEEPDKYNTQLVTKLLAMVPQWRGDPRGHEKREQTKAASIAYSSVEATRRSAQ